MDVSQKLVAHVLVGRRHAVLHMHGEHVDDMVIQSCCVVFQAPVLFTGKVVTMIQQVPVLSSSPCRGQCLLRQVAALQWIVIGNSHKNHPGIQWEVNVNTFCYGAWLCARVVVKRREGDLHVTFDTMNHRSFFGVFSGLHLSKKTFSNCVLYV